MATYLVLLASLGLASQSSSSASSLAVPGTALMEAMLVLACQDA